MSTQQTAKTQYVTLSDNTEIAYRTFGNPTEITQIPLVLLMHFRGTMDHWDPALLNNLSTQRRLILLDNAGVGKSTGEVPTTHAGWAAIVIAFLQALQVTEADLLGFSMGGCAAQMVALNAPAGLIRKLVLVGTTASHGPGVTNGDSAYVMECAVDGTDDEIDLGVIDAFYYPTPAGIATGKASVARILERQPATSGEDRSHFLQMEGTGRQIMAAQAWASGPSNDNSYDRLGELKMPVLVAHGDRDALFPTPNAFVLYERIRNARLAVYPESGHGILYQYAEEFGKTLGEFLDGKTEEVMIKGNGFQGK